MRWLIVKPGGTKGETTRHLNGNVIILVVGSFSLFLVVFPQNVFSSISVKLKRSEPGRPIPGSVFRVQLLVVRGILCPKTGVLIEVGCVSVNVPQVHASRGLISVSLRRYWFVSLDRRMRTLPSPLQLTGQRTVLLTEYRERKIRSPGVTGNFFIFNKPEQTW